jgi:hypothetical protein
MATFEQLFPTFLVRCAELRSVLSVVAYFLVIVGIIMTGMRRPSVRGWTRYLVRVLISVTLLVYLPQWGDEMQRLVADTVTNTLKADPDKVLEAYQNALAIKQGPADNKSAWDIIADFRSSVVNALIAGALWLLSYAAALLVYWAYIFQKVILNVGYALSPILIGFLAVPALSQTGGRYLLNLVGVILWPLGWGVGSLIAQGIIDFMTDQSFLSFDPLASLYLIQNLFGLGILSFWTVFHTCAAPVMIQKVLTHGAEIGSELMGSGIATSLQTAATTAGAAAVMAPARSSLATAAAAGTAAALSTISLSAGMGSTGAILFAANGLPAGSFRRRPGDDITGDRAVRDLLSTLRQQKP